MNDISGKRFGTSVVISFSHKSRSQMHWLARCDCGNTRTVWERNLRRNANCPKCRGAKIGLTQQTHGDSSGGKRTKEYLCWKRIRTRCTNPNNNRWEFYGGRGIKVCERWQAFENFLADMGRAPSTKHSIDRIDVNGNYEPGNCRWANMRQQARNKTSNRLLSINGEVQCLAEWAKRSGVLEGTITQRIRRGWPEQHWLLPVGHL